MSQSSTQLDVSQMNIENTNELVYNSQLQSQSQLRSENETASESESVINTMEDRINVLEEKMNECNERIDELVDYFDEHDVTITENSSNIESLNKRMSVLSKGVRNSFVYTVTKVIALVATASAGVYVYQHYAELMN
jgi:uncharacterized coiled-coil DUF342 family protein